MLQLTNQSSWEKNARLISIHVSFLRYFFLNRIVFRIFMKKGVIDYDSWKERNLHFMITMRCIYLNLKKYWLLTLEMVEVQLSIFWQLFWGRQVNQWIFPEQILIMILLKAFLLFTNHFRRHLTMWAHDLN